MPHYTPLIATIVAGLVFAFIFGSIAQRLRISPLVGYLLAGVVAGPYTPGFVADQALAQELAELGVILLMFGVGLHFSLKDLLSVRAIAIPGALAQIAAATLNFSSLRKPIFVVDTHILRLAKRLGLLPAKAGFAHAHRLLNGLIPNDWTERDHYQLHWLMKSHGQKVCRHRVPLCSDRPLRNVCRHFTANGEQAMDKG